MSWNPFDWTAGPFLAFYVTVAVVLFAWGFSLRSMLGPAAHATRQLGPLELAFLAGGARRLGDAALLSLTSGNGTTIDPAGRTITVTDQSPLKALINRPPTLSVQRDMTRQQFQRAVEPLVERVQRRLQELGYCPTDQQIASFRMSVLPLVGLLLLFGVTRAALGETRHHPIGFLIILLMFTAAAGFVLAQRPARTRAGKNALAAYRSSHARAARAPLDSELLLAVALSGPVVLAGTAYAPVYAASKTMGSSSDGGGGCGGGGDGGGGCGGCSS